METAGPTLELSRHKLLRRLTDLAYFAAEYIVLPRIQDTGPGPISRLLFRCPLILYRLGLGWLVSRHVLLLTTIGRNSGKQRVTPIGYVTDIPTSTYYLSAGWEGRVNWYRNARAEPKVHVRVGNTEFDAVVERVEERVAMRLLADYTRRNPFAERLWSRVLGVPFDGSDETMRRVVACFPTVALRRLDAFPTPSRSLSR